MKKSHLIHDPSVKSGDHPLRLAAVDIVAASFTFLTGILCYKKRVFKVKEIYKLK